MRSLLALLWLLWGGQAAAVGRSLAVSVQDVRMPDGDRELDIDTDETSKAGPQRTRMQCLGTETLTRACHFENVYFDLSSSRFVHYGIEGATADVFGDPQKPNEPWLRMIRGQNGWKAGTQEGKTQFFMDWRPGEALPPAGQVVTYTQPLHLRGPYNTISIGHLLRDNLQYLIDLPLRFGRDPTDFDWVRWHSKMAFSDWEEESSTAEHYRGLLNNRPSLTWQQVLDQALKGKDKAGVKYIQFAELIAGQGPADVMSQLGRLWGHVTTAKKSAWAHMCDPFPFTAMRKVAYRNYGLEVASVHELEPFVLFLDGQRQEKRHLANAPELIPKLKKAFPGVRMEHVEISAHPLEAQLQLLAKATVLVSNIGSRSFRLIYLPNGATTILVGPPEFEFDLEPSPKATPDGDASSDGTYTISRPFLEIDWCWGYIGYVNMLRYRVQSEAEVRRTKPWTVPMHARNTDVVLNEEKITKLLRVALERTQHSTAQHGTGQLAAYNS